ncbi:sodium/proton antiporter, CPA1 family [Ekhidna lutea]|uniref:Sodium/proton antiporter, CPA1 family n=1 Tax=Ekhidna lutea TaxID=447679 RepID=A0A239GLJ1_EKHLU|nr:cation:proton antiporter [Ekhidna lutea]SNS69755.1 sodium/proton antiporter, CPA1 family [Ekhidna lutea]
MEYYIIIAASLIIILSYLFNMVSDKSSIPSVLLLILLGVVGRELIGLLGVEKERILEIFSRIRILEVLGTLGLILIVLEAALELKIAKDKLKLISKSFIIALSGLILCMFAIATILIFSFKEMDWSTALIYATPLSILSSAIVIPSVVNLNEKDEEFHIYESTFSDILGIMIFYFLVELGSSTSNVMVLGDFTFGLVVTIVLSIILSYVLIYVFQNLETKVKLFLMIGVLFLLFSIGKLMHLSSLLIILVFGLILNNYKLFFVGRLKKYLRPMAIENIRETFLMITIESAFVVRTFFFVIFGFSIALSTLLDIKVAIISAAILIVIYVTRVVSFLPYKHENLRRAISIAPRGLITLLLFYSIPDEFIFEGFKSGILLFIIIVTSLVMTSGLVKKDKKNDEEISEVE